MVGVLAAFANAGRDAGCLDVENDRIVAGMDNTRWDSKQLVLQRWRRIKIGPTE